MLGRGLVWFLGWWEELVVAFVNRHGNRFPSKLSGALAPGCGMWNVVGRDRANPATTRAVPGGGREKPPGDTGTTATTAPQTRGRERNTDPAPPRRNDPEPAGALHHTNQPNRPTGTKELRDYQEPETLAPNETRTNQQPPRPPTREGGPNARCMTRHST